MAIIYPKPTRSNFNDIEGRVFGCWTVLSYAGSNKYAVSRWDCQCDCGTLATRDGTALTNRLIAHRGETRCVSEWAEILGINNRTILSRLRRGASDSNSLKPVGE